MGRSESRGETPSDPPTRGMEAAAADLLPEVYAELRRLARLLMRKVPPGNTLQPTALVHEAYLRLVAKHDPGWDGRRHFFAAAARAMREILVDQARRKARRKHGGDRVRVGSGAELAIEPPTDDMLALDEALRRLEAAASRTARVVELRYFAGLTAAETAVALGVSRSTVEREWRFARAFLHSQLVPPGSSNRRA